jgi:hypothetical protein
MFIIDDSFATSEQIKEIHDAFLDVPKDLMSWVYWVFLPYTSSPEIHKHFIADNKDTDEDMLLVTSVENGSIHYNKVKGLLDIFASKHNIAIDQIIRAKVNLYFKSENTKHHTPHVDFNKKHLVFLYFLNDSDGDTVFFKDNGLKQAFSVEPKAGRAVVFDGSMYHASQSPKQNKTRSTLNINFTERES